MTKLFSTHAAVLASHVTVGAAQGVAVFDGPQAVTVSGSRLVIVGCDDIEAPAPVLAVDNGAQEFVSIGGYTKDETFNIWCIYQGMSGDSGGYTSLRADAETFVEAVEWAVNLNNPDQGVSGPDGALGPTGWAGISITQIRQGQMTSGPALRVQYVIACTTRLFSGS